MQSQDSSLLALPRTTVSRNAALRYATLTGILIALTGSSLTAQKTVQLDLKDTILPLINSHQGVVAVSIKHLPTGEAYAYNGDRLMPTASLIKFPVLVTAFHAVAEGTVNWDDRIELKESDKVPGSGVLTDHFSAGTQLSVRDAARLMIAFSDNTATNLVLDQIGLKATAERMESLGLANTKLHAKVFRHDTSVFPERTKQFGLGSTTANEMARLFELLWNNQLVSAEACDEMKTHLFACDDRSKIGKHLPSGVKFAHKTGAVSRSRCDAGVIDGAGGATIICVLTAENADQVWTDDNAANRLCAEIGRAVYRHFHVGSAPELDATVPRTLVKGSAGSLVKMLQRTLNKRLSPSPELAMDGDFGPATARAVEAFQNSNGLDPTGVVDALTWKAIGTLETKDDPVPPPSVVNAIVHPKNPPDDLDGPPLVTCKAWAILDAANGELLAGHRHDDPLDMASTTKIMTAYVALQCCEQRPELLSETVVFSQRADQTRGSTSDVAAGEKVPVRELLYGLLLPSGNDASVAIAEFFGRYADTKRPHNKEDQSDLNAAQREPVAAAERYDRFVAAMNRAAADLGIDASFKNTHGLTAKGHRASAKGLAILAREAMKNDLFRTIVGTRQRGCTLQSLSGYQRNVIWKNTNRLLGTQGYFGIKTGTTDAAGACLVSYSERQDDALVVVVLGATSSSARYVDTRNLFRWAWSQRGRAIAK